MIVTLPTALHLKFDIVSLFLNRFEIKKKNVEIVIGRAVAYLERRPVGAPQMSIPRKTRMRHLTHMLIVVKNVAHCVNSIDNIIVRRLRYEVITNHYFIFYYGWVSPYIRINVTLKFNH